MLITIIILCIILIAALYFSVRRNLENADKIDALYTQIEKSLDVLDTCYQRAAKRAELEVMSDEPVVRELVQDIQLCRETILLVANLIVEPLDVDKKESNE